jgi:hypothetical protein
VYKLIQTTSSALAAVSLVTAALGFAIVGKPLRADEPLNIGVCGDCTIGCPVCPREGYFYCDNSDNKACGCDCDLSNAVVCGLTDLPGYECLQPL